MKWARTSPRRNPMQGNLLNPNDTPQFFGETFSPAQDGARLSSQQNQVEALMADGYWWTLANIRAMLRHRHPGTQHGEASISARLRDMRRRGWNVERQRARAGGGLFLYRATKAEDCGKGSPQC